MHYHWQNLNERQDGTTGLGLVHGRAWWYFGVESHARLGAEWCFSRRFRIGVSVERGGHNALAGHVSLGWFTLYLHVDGVALRWWPVEGYDGHEYAIGFDAEDARVRWAWNGNPMSWSRGDPWWKSGSKSLYDVILGRPKYREGAPETHRIHVVMPEAAYEGTCVMRADSWKRPLWFRKTIRRAHIDMDEGQQVPVPGKGENSWDCGEDGIFGMTCVANTVEEAVEAVRASAFRSREKYASRDWVPSAAR